MGATGSQCNCMDQLLLLTNINSIRDRVSALEIHHAKLQEKQDAISKEMSQKTLEMNQMMSRLITVEQKASNMLFQSEETEDDLILIES